MMSASRFCIQLATEMWCEGVEESLFCLKTGDNIWFLIISTKFCTYITIFFQSPTWEQSIWWSVRTSQMMNVSLQTNVTKVKIFFNYLKLWASAALHGLQVLSVKIIRASLNIRKQWNELKSYTDADWWFSTFPIASKKKECPQ